jgi:hypothetical protein
MPAAAPPASSAQSLAAMALREMGADAPTTQSLMRIAVVLATTVNKAPGLKGLEKQKLVVDALREVLATPMIADQLDDTAKAVLADAVNNIIPQTLALVVEAGRSGALKKPTAGCVGSFVALFCRSAASAVVAAKAGPPEVAQALSDGAAVIEAVSADAVVVADTEPAAPAAETSEPAVTQVEQEQTSASAESSQPPSTEPVEQ